jgi:S1-C subfamily serine protease
VASVSLAARLVEVIADLGEAAAERYRYGSGCIVGGRTVLTAAHVVAGAQRVQVRDPHKRLYSATVDPGFVGDVSGPGPDLALVEIVDPGFKEELSPIGLAAIDRESPPPSRWGAAMRSAIPGSPKAHRRRRCVRRSMRSASCRWPRGSLKGC